MIGSLMSRLGDAEKLSVGQLQKAIQDGTIPAYVGVPLLQDKIKQHQLAQQAMAPQQQPPIAQQVMQEAQGIEAAQSNLPETYADGGILNFQPESTYDADHEYAAGGMVAFAEGDLVDDEEDDDSTPDFFDKLGASAQAEQEDMLRQYMANSKEMPEGISAIGINFERPTGEGIRPEAKAPRGIESLGFVEKIRKLESGGRHTDKEGNILTSSKGAEGIMQVMPFTQKDPGYGVKPAKDKSAAELERVGIDYANAMLRKYDGNEKLAAMAYNWGPGNVDKWIAGGMKGPVPGETRQYAANFAQGGIASIKHFDEGGVSRFSKLLGLDEESPRFQEYQARNKAYKDLIGAYQSQPGLFEKVSPEKLAESEKNIADAAAAFKAPMKKYEAATTPEGGAVPYVPGTDDTYDPDLNKGSRGTSMMDEIAAQKEIDARAALEKQKEEEKQKTIKEEAETPAAKMQALLDKQFAKIEKQREQDKYMSLLAAGLGMMGGTSPFAAANIGQGAMKGIEAQMAANKLASQQEAYLNKAQLGAHQLAQTDATRKMLAAQAQEGKYLGMLKDAKLRAMNSIAAAKKMDLSTIEDKNILATIEREAESFLAKDPGYRAIYDKVYPGGLNVTGGAAPAPVNYQSTYGLTPKK